MIAARSAKSRAFPSITGSAASGPMLPSPSTADPSVTTATLFCRIVSRQTLSGSSAIAREMRATPGVYTSDRSSRVRTLTRPFVSILPPRCIRNARSDTLRTRTPSIRRRSSWSCAPMASSGQSTVTSRTWTAGVASTRSIAPRLQPRSPTTVATCANMPGRLAISSRKTRRNAGLNAARGGASGTPVSVSRSPARRSRHGTQSAELVW